MAPLQPSSLSHTIDATDVRAASTAASDPAAKDNGGWFRAFFDAVATRWLQIVPPPDDISNTPRITVAPHQDAQKHFRSDEQSGRHNGDVSALLLSQSRDSSWHDVRQVVRRGSEGAWDSGQALIVALAPLRWLAHAIDVAHTYSVVLVLTVCYLKGPTVFGYGMWGGIATHDICVRAGAMTMSDWALLGPEMAHERCISELRRRVDMLVVSFWLLVLFAAWSCVAFALVFVCLCRRARVRMHAATQHRRTYCCASHLTETPRTHSIALCTCLVAARNHSADGGNDDDNEEDFCRQH